MTMSTVKEMQSAKDADKAELQRHLAIARRDGYLERAPDEAGQILMGRTIDALEKIEKAYPGVLAKLQKTELLASLRHVARACRVVIVREEKGEGLKFRMRGLKP